MRSAFAPTAGDDRARPLTIVGLVVVPVLIAFLLGWSLAAPQADASRVTAAVVNDDDPVTVNGQTVPLGRELAAQLIGGEAGTGAPDDPGADATATPDPAQGFTWILTNDDDARSGLADGTYAAVVRIPPDFSARATSISGPAAQAVQAVVDVSTTPATAFLDPALTDVITRTAVSALNAELTERYLTQVYQGFNQIGSSIAQASDGAAELASGAASLSSGADELSTGADTLAAGIDEVNSGAASLASGLGRLDSSVQGLPGDARRLAGGAAQVAGALDAGAAALTAVTAEFRRVVDDICATRTGAVCRRAQRALANLETASSDVRALAGGADEVAAGNAALAVALSEVVSALDRSASGADELAAGTAKSAKGAGSVASGAGSVASGAGNVSDGADQLADGLAQAVTQIPTYSDSDITILSQTVAQPVTTDFQLPPAGTQSVPLFTVVALWIGAILSALAFSAVPRRRLLSSTSTLSLVGRTLALPVVIGVAQGALAAAALSPFVDVDIGGRLAVAGVAVLVGAVFAAVNVGAAALLGGVGRSAAAIAGVVALVVGVSSTVPPALVSLDAFLPTGPARDVMLAAEGYGPFAPVLGLVLWGLVGVAATAAGVSRHRTGARALTA